MSLKVVYDRLFKYDNFRITSDFLLEVLESTHSVLLVQLNQIVTNCVEVKQSDKVYLIEMPNMVEVEWCKVK